uniref:Protein-S-isoprenylcysteine O-methyltransferase n=1 Tax=Trichuris muris TaxID=70415 RepID=A0A5S6QPK2_TRIMR
MLLGSVYAMGLYQCTKGHWRQPSSAGLYLCVLSFFHFSEFVSIALFSGKSLSTDSFLLNHSVEYWIAAVSSWIEYVIELHQFPNAKKQPLITYFGFTLVLIGELLRKAAIVNAGDCFTHLVSFHKRPEHQLVTSGIYSFCRHPSYTGWLLWSVGTQILLCNPACTVLYAVVSWKFLAERIRTEEQVLILFFGSKYTKYRAIVPSGIPFVR